jgi:hypothetical protein
MAMNRSSRSDAFGCWLIEGPSEGDGLQGLTNLVARWNCMAFRHSAGIDNAGNNLGMRCDASYDARWCWSIPKRLLANAKPAPLAQASEVCLVPDTPGEGQRGAAFQGVASARRNQKVNEMPGTGGTG